MQKTVIPRQFKERYSRLLGQENKLFLKFCEKKLRKTLRVNTLKISPQKLKEILELKGLKLKKLGFCDYAFSVEEGPERLGLMLEHELGLFYLQEASSLIPSIALNPKENETVLDLAAAPGSKTTHLAQLMKNKGLLYAADISSDRIPSLKYNVERMGIINAVIINADATKFNPGIQFDKILLDAPCSSEGLVRKEWNALSTWSEKLIFEKSGLQKKLILNAFSLLKKGGELVYSTCTLAPEENEEVIDFLLKKKNNARIEKIELKGFKTRKGITEWRGKKFSAEAEKALRIYPQDNDTEAFFIAKIGKE